MATRTTTLDFAEKDGSWVATYTSSGPAVVQMMRTERGGVSVTANLEGMDPKVIYGDTEYDAGENYILEVDVPQGVVVRIESGSKVTGAKMLTEETA